MSPDRPVQVSAERVMLALERDPCPGDVARVRAVAGTLRSLADGCASGAVSAAGWRPAVWDDAVAHAVAGHVGRVVAGAGVLRRSLEQAGDALDAWAAELAGLQAEADGLDREAVELQRRRDSHAVTARALVMDPVAGLDGGAALRQAQVEADLRRLRQRADDLHLRWLARSRRHAAELDAAAPPRGGTAAAWRGGWDHGHDVASVAVRGLAPLLALQARATGTASTAAGLVAVALPPTAPVAGPLSVALAAGSTHARGVLAVGADSSSGAVVSAAASTVLAGVSVAGPAARAVDPVTGTSRAADTGLRAGDAATGAGLGAEAGSWLPAEHTGERWTADLASQPGGGDVTVTDVAEPWQTRTGGLLPTPADRFTGVAVVTVPLTAVGGPGPRRPPGPTRPTGDARPPTGPVTPAGRPAPDRS